MQDQLYNICVTNSAYETVGYLSRSTKHLDLARCSHEVPIHLATTHDFESEVRLQAPRWSLALPLVAGVRRN